MTQEQNQNLVDSIHYTIACSAHSWALKRTSVPLIYYINPDNTKTNLKSHYNTGLSMDGING